MAGLGGVVDGGSTPNYMTQDQFSSQLDAWWKKQQPLAQSQPIGAQGQSANIYQPTYGQAPAQQYPQYQQQQQFSPLSSWSPMGMGYGSGYGSGYGMQSPFGGYGMQSPFSGYGMQQSPFGGMGGYGGYGQQMYSPYGGMGSGFGMGGMGFGGYGMQTPFGGGYGMGYQQPMYGGYGGFGRGRDFGYGRPAPAPTNVTTPDAPGTTA